jgi:uncharacterized protein YndB with AHSA1/START domain
MSDRTALAAKPNLATKPSLATKPGLTLERRFAAPPHKVYSAWTKAQELAFWFGPAGAEALSAEIDARVGGRYRIAFRTPDGEKHEVGGTYLEVVPNERLTFTWAWYTTPERQSLVTLRFAADAGGTSFTLTHEQFFDEAARDAHRGGWGSALDKLEAYLA